MRFFLKKNLRVDLYPFRILSICSGVGGIELGFKLAEPSSRTVCYVEIEAFACEILARRMEEKRLDAAPVWTNLKTFDGKPWRGKVDCITGGYPCQPFSVAGKKLGTNDPRHLWPDIKRLITEIEPPICFFENVSNHLRVGFEEVANDLRQLGYKIKTGLFAAEEVGAPHKRERLFILAYGDSFGSSMQSNRDTAALERKSTGEEARRNQFAQTTEDCSSGNMADCSFGRCSNGRDNITKRHLYQNSFGEFKEDQQKRNERIAGSCQNSEDLGRATARELAYNNSDRCVSDESEISGKNDQERWQKCSEKSIACRDDFAASEFSEEQRGFTETTSGSALSGEEVLVNCDNSGLQETRTEFSSARFARRESELADCQNIVCQWCEQQRSGSGKSEAKAGSDDNELADSESSGTRKHERELWQGSEKHCRKLGNSNNERLERQCQCQCSDQLPAWPPSPSLYAEWDRIPNHLKPALHRMADGLADRVDRIRACGNGVVPLVAAYAWRTLTNGMYLTKDN